MSQIRRRVLLVLAAGLLFSNTSAAMLRPEQACQSARASVAAKYASCALKALATGEAQSVKFAAGASLPGYEKAVGKCVIKYAAAWPRLQAKAKGKGSTCDSPRFVDNGDGTVIDLLTALQWEKKDDLDGVQDPGDPHDADNYYFWDAGVVGEAPANSTVFTKFLASLNDPNGCFAGECDWRLPTRDELLTIAMPRCTAGSVGSTACIDPAFGPTVASVYWSDTTFPIVPSTAWTVDFGSFGVSVEDKSDRIAYDRAVRGGL